MKNQGTGQGPAYRACRMFSPCKIGIPYGQTEESSPKKSFSRAYDKFNTSKGKVSRLTMESWNATVVSINACGVFTIACVVFINACGVLRIAYYAENFSFRGNELVIGKKPTFLRGGKLGVLLMEDGFL